MLDNLVARLRTETPMAAYTMIVMSTPVPGMEAEYNAWYSDEHLGDVLRTEGFRSARRLKVCAGYDSEHPYFAVYEIETDDPQETMRKLMARMEAGEWVVSKALGPAQVILLEAITPVIPADGSAPKGSSMVDGVGWV
jgi:hypothetical protein